MTVWTVLRALVLLGLAWGAWTNFRNTPRSFTFEGRRYYPLPDGRFCTRWGRIVTDPVLQARLVHDRSMTPPDTGADQ